MSGHALAQADANAVRITHPPIAVHLTPFAPGCERLAIGHPDRWRTFHARPAISVVRTVLTRLRLDPAACRASAEPNGDTGLLAPVPPERLRLVAADDQDLAGAPVPQALFFDGLTPAQLGACLTELAQARWTPAASGSGSPQAARPSGHSSPAGGVGSGAPCATTAAPPRIKDPL